MEDSEMMFTIGDDVTFQDHTYKIKDLFLKGDVLMAELVGRNIEYVPTSQLKIDFNA